MPKQIQLLLAAILTAVLLTACGSSDSDAALDEESTATETDDSAETESEEAAETTETEDDPEAETETEEATDDSASEESASSEQVEVNLIDELDGIINGYCLDIAGGNESVDPANGLQAHTCYSYDGSLGTDQVFDTAEFANNALYMPIYDVCAEVASLAAGSEIGLNACDGSELQTLQFDADGTIRPAADTTLCVTAGDESRTGRSGDHQIRDLSLESCSDDLASLQQWSSRTGL